MSNSWEIYDRLIARAESHSADTAITNITLGLTWTLCHCQNPQGEGFGLAMSPGQYTRTLPWSGTLTKRPIQEIIPWIKSWNAFESSIALSVINAVINSSSTTLTAQPIPVANTTSPNLAVFEYFLPRLKNKKVVVIGRYPGLERYLSYIDLTVLERNPGDDDLPDTACEYLIPTADWVFITGSSIANKTFPRLAALASNAVTVLMGPSVPWLEDWAEYGIDFLAGVQICNSGKLQATVVEGGGVRIFNQAIQYHVLDLGQGTMQSLKSGIAELIAKRDRLKTEMNAWYDQCSSSRRGRFPKWSALEKIDHDLSLLDLRYKRQWDARQSV